MISLYKKTLAWHKFKQIYARFARIRNNTGMFKATNRPMSGMNTAGYVMFYVQKAGAIKIRSVAVNAKSNCSQTVTAYVFHVLGTKSQLQSFVISMYNYFQKIIN